MISKMPESTEKKDMEEPIDLSVLAGLTFGPSWSDPKAVIKPRRSEREDDRGGRKQSGQGRPAGGSRDRRPQMERSGGERSRQGSAGEVFYPTVEVSFYPEDDPFLALIKAIRASCKTYELFELAGLILEKPERLVAVIRGKPSDNGVSRKLYVCPIDSMPFESEEEALRYVFKNYLGNFFEVEEVDVEPPKGSFPVINRCGITGELLGPPNYHRYQEFLKEHFANNLSNVSYDRFLSKIESVKDEEVAKAWMEKMSKGKRYTFKKVGEGETAPVFNTWEEARAFILSRCKNELVQEVNSVRFHGSSLAQMPRGDIRRSFELYLKMQREFPLDTANNIRGRLRRMNLAIYKKGSRGITYVCAVKRKFRQEGVSFSENLQSLVDFIEKHPNCLVSKLPELYLGIQVAATGAATEGGEPAVAVLTPEQQSQIKKLMLDLRWLVSEGYVTEYGNSTLFAPAPMSSAKAVAEGQEEVSMEEGEVVEALDSEVKEEPRENEGESAEDFKAVAKEEIAEVSGEGEEASASKKKVKKAPAKKEASAAKKPVKTVKKAKTKVKEEEGEEAATESADKGVEAVE